MNNTDEFVNQIICKMAKDMPTNSIEEQVLINEIGLFIFMDKMNNCIKLIENLCKLTGASCEKIPLWTPEDWVRMCKKNDYENINEKIQNTMFEM